MFRFESNHEHLVVYDRYGRYPEFTEYLHKLIALGGPQFTPPSGVVQYMHFFAFGAFLRLHFGHDAGTTSGPPQ